MASSENVIPSDRQRPLTGRVFESAAEPQSQEILERSPTRRGLVTQGAKLLVYAAPAVQLFRPTQALAASGLSPTS